MRRVGLRLCKCRRRTSRLSWYVCRLGSARVLGWRIGRIRGRWLSYLSWYHYRREIHGELLRVALSFRYMTCYIGYRSVRSTGPLERETTIMNAMREYFEYEDCPECGTGADSHTEIGLDLGAYGGPYPFYQCDPIAAEFYEWAQTAPSLAGVRLA